MTEDASLASHAVVTGGGRGIGLAVAAALKAEGMRVTVIGRTPAALDAAVERGVADAGVSLDLTDEKAVSHAFAQLADTGPISILVNNVGAASSAPFARTDAAAFRHMLDVNLMSAVYSCHAVLPAMVAAKAGRIVNIASTAALKGYPYVSAYVAAKHALLGFTRALASETARTGVTVNAVCPGFTETELLAGSVTRIMRQTGRDEAAARGDLMRANPQGRFVQPDEVAAAVAFLCRANARAITGAAIPVAGGEV